METGSPRPAIASMLQMKQLYQAGARPLAAVLFGALLLSSTPAGAQSEPTPAARATAVAEPSDDEPEIDEVKFTIGMAGSVSPTYSGSDQVGYALAPAGRIVWRCSYHLAPLAGDPDHPRTNWMLQRWTDLLGELAEGATRFRLESGETLLADNTVVFHGRDPYEDLSRLLWRVWAWTPRAARPDTEYVVSDTSRVGG